MRRAVSCNRALFSQTVAQIAEYTRCGLSSVAAPHWVFLGPPGVGKGTYSKRIAEYLKLPHISTGDIVRSEIESGSKLGKKFQEIANGGNLLSDELILTLLDARLAQEKRGFILDGFPRTRAQAEQLSHHTDIHLVVNMSLREEALVKKCLGRRICSKCKKDYNIADIHLKAEDGHREIVMPPIMPPRKECLQYMVQREDDKEEVVKKRLEVYKAQAKPIEDYYRNLGILLDFEVTGAIPSTWPQLIKALHDYLPTTHSDNKQQEIFA